MKFTDSEYSTADFKKVERFYTNFWYNEVSTGPGLTWCTGYFYKKMKDNTYRYVQVDTEDEEMYLHEELSLEDFVEAINMEQEFEDYIDDKVLAFFPEDLQPYGVLAKPHFTELKAKLLIAANRNKDERLVKALLPDFDELRKQIRHFDKDEIATLELERERTVDGRLQLSFSFEKEGNTAVGSITYHDGDDYILVDEEVYFINPKTAAFFKEVYESEYQCYPFEED